MDTKVCTICKVQKEILNFHFRNKQKQIKHNVCKDCQSLSASGWYKKNKLAHSENCKKWYLENKNKKYATAREWNEENKDHRRLKRRESHLKCKFNITTEQYEKMLKAQNGECAICFTQEFKGNGNKAVVDHCYTSGRVRGLLCMHCNSAIGQLKESKQILLSAVEYLEFYHNEFLNKEK
jgi:hypothetical protein